MREDRVRSLPRKPSSLGELIQPSAAAGADLAPVLLGFFTSEVKKWHGKWRDPLGISMVNGCYIWFMILITMVMNGFTTKYQWIGFVGKILTGNPWLFTIKFDGVSCKCSHHPVL